MQEFTFPKIIDERNLAYLDQILCSDSVSIHIRRGDYITLNVAWTPEHYLFLVKKFIETLSDQWHLFVFSDDISWCKEHAEEMGFQQFKEVTYVEGNTHGENYRDLQLMTMCKAMIMSNSAFCYLAALLNTHRKYVLNPTPRRFP